jgi:ABC-type multidrug transport system ATPase subunit
MTEVLSRRGLRKRFGDLTAVDDVTFTISAGETYGLLSLNGAGKTTIISMVAGILRPDAGEVLVEGVPVSTRTTEPKGRIGYVPQELAEWPRTATAWTCSCTAHASASPVCCRRWRSRTSTSARSRSTNRTWRPSSCT